MVVFFLDASRLSRAPTSSRLRTICAACTYCSRPVLLTHSGTSAATQKRTQVARRRKVEVTLFHFINSPALLTLLNNVCAYRWLKWYKHQYQQHTETKEPRLTWPRGQARGHWRTVAGSIRRRVGLWWAVPGLLTVPVGETALFLHHVSGKHVPQRAPVWVNKRSGTHFFHLTFIQEHDMAYAIKQFAYILWELNCKLYHYSQAINRTWAQYMDVDVK